MDVRKTTNRIIELAEDGVISWKDIATMALHWLPESDVAEMYKANGLDFDEEDEE
jgi:hypothetical protein